jgi:hypothetical protein
VLSVLRCGCAIGIRLSDELLEFALRFANANLATWIPARFGYEGALVVSGGLDLQVPKRVPQPVRHSKGVVAITSISL